MTDAELIDWARRRWAVPLASARLTRDDGTVVESCPPEVVSALLDLLTEAAADGTSKLETHTATLRALNEIREARLVCLP